MQIKINDALNGYIVSSPKSATELYDYNDYICVNMDEVVARVKELFVNGTA